MTTTLHGTQSPEQTAPDYARLEERILARDQKGAHDAFVDLVRAGRPMLELVHQTVRIHAPYTHVPFHQRLDGGLVKFVNNDHCLLSAGATMRLAKRMPAGLQHLPLAQTIWYVPTGLDPWNQLLGNAPGHYARMYEVDVSAAPPPPSVHWTDQEPLYVDGTLEERLNHWLTLVQRSEVVTAYRIFLGLLENEADRATVLSQLVFAGLIDVQDRMLFNRSYTTGHKAYRARTTVELGEAIGWPNAHAIVYAGVPDLGVGPHWYSTFEMACNVAQTLLDGRDFEMRANTGALTPAQQATLEDVILHGREPAWQYQISDLLKAGVDPLRILDIVQLSTAQLLLECGAPENYSMPQHSAEYCNTLRWYFDRFTHPHQIKLLYVAAAMANQAAHHQAADPKNGQPTIRVPRGVEAWSQDRLLTRLDQALLGRDTDSAVALTAAYVRTSFDRRPLVQLLATVSTQFGNDPHNQEIGLSLLEDYFRSSANGRDRLLLACAKHIAGYRKYGDPLEAYRRYTEAFDIDAPTARTADGDAPVEALLFDD
jgi:hypothetical protein